MLLFPGRFLSSEATGREGRYKETPMNLQERQSLLSLLANHLRTTDDPEDTKLADRITKNTLTEDDYETLQGVCEMALEDHKLSNES